MSINELKAQLNEAQKKLEETENKLNETTELSENKDIILKYLQFKKENEKLNNEIIYNKNIIEINKGDSDLKKLNLELNNELKETKDSLSDLKKELEETNINENENFENYKKNDYNEEFIGKKSENFYDIIININSLKSLANKNEGWKIKWNDNIELTHQLLKKSTELLKIGILGNENVGKSFLLSRIFEEKNIPYGYSVPTEGLSIKFNLDRMYALFDTAGFQKPIIQNLENININEDNNLSTSIINEKNEYLEIYKDKIQLENFLQKLIVYLSDILIVVVGKITLIEQKLINKIKKEISEKNSKIFIIHNLSNFGRKAQVEEYINNILLKSASFKLIKIEDKEKKDKKKEEQSQIFFIEDNSDPLIFHLIIGKELTEAGNYYNNFAFKFIIERFNDFAKRKPLSILEEIKNKFAEWSVDLLEQKIEPENIIIKTDEKVEKQFIYESNINQDKENENENENDKKDLEIEEDKNQWIIPKTCITDEYGYPITDFANNLEPPYTCYVEDNQLLVIKIQILGNIKIEAYGDIDSNQVFIEGIKDEKEELISLDNNNSSFEQNKNEDKKIIILKNTRKSGNFKLIIPLGNEIKLADEDPIDKKEEEKEEGIKIIKFQLVKRSDRKKKKIFK